MEFAFSFSHLARRQSAARFLRRRCIQKVGDGTVGTTTRDESGDGAPAAADDAPAADDDGNDDDWVQDIVEEDDMMDSRV